MEQQLSVALRGAGAVLWGGGAELQMWSGMMSQASEESAESSNTTAEPMVTQQGMGDDGMHQGHTMQPTTVSGSGGGFTDINTWGSFHGSNHNSEQNELVGGRTAITTEALLAYNGSAEHLRPG